MMGTERRGRDRRKDRRYNSGGRVRIWQTESGVYLAGSIVDLSMGGCLVHVPATGDLELHSIVEASLQSSYLAFRSMGSVRRIDEKNSLVGINYLNLSLRGRLDLAELFADLDALIAEGYWNASGSRRASPPEPAEQRRRIAATARFLLPP
jgi:PilZ domain